MTSSTIPQEVFELMLADRTSPVIDRWLDELLILEPLYDRIAELIDAGEYDKADEALTRLEKHSWEFSHAHLVYLRSALGFAQTGTVTLYDMVYEVQNKLLANMDDGISYTVDELASRIGEAQDDVFVALCVAKQNGTAYYYQDDNTWSR